MWLFCVWECNIVRLGLKFVSLIIESLYCNGVWETIKPWEIEPNPRFLLWVRLKSLHIATLDLWRVLLNFKYFCLQALSPGGYPGVGGVEGTTLDGDGAFSPNSPYFPFSSPSRRPHMNGEFYFTVQFIQPKNAFI